MAAYRDLAKRLQDAFGPGDLEIFLRNGPLIVQLPSRILFDSGKAEVKTEGRFKSNWELSTLRGVSVVNVLLSEIPELPAW